MPFHVARWCTDGMVENALSPIGPSCVWHDGAGSGPLCIDDGMDYGREPTAQRTYLAILLFDVTVW